MELREHLLALVAPVRPGADLAPGTRLVEASSELGLRLTFELRGTPVHVELEPFDASRRHVVRTRRLMLSYRAADGALRIEPLAGEALCRAVAALVGPNEDAVLTRIEAEAAAFATRDDAGRKVREVEVDRLLVPVGAPPRACFTISPYVGCLIGCRFCYAQSRVAIARRLAGLPEVAWGSYVDVRVNAPEVLRRELDAAPQRPVKFCPIVSDPYQAVEKRYELTRRCLEVLRDARPPRAVIVLTRARLVERDAALLASIPRAWAGVSLPTLDEDAAAHFEPRAASVADRLAALRALKDAGVRTFAVVQPPLPGPLDAFADALAAHAGSVSIDVLHGVEGAEREFADARFREAASDSWQRERAEALADALRRRGVALWATDELPPDLDA